MRASHFTSAPLTAAFASAMLIAGAAPACAQAAAEETWVIIAAQIRAQGYPCSKPTTASRDADLSKPDRPVWILRCEDATYRVRLAPGMASSVERISD